MDELEDDFIAFSSSALGGAPNPNRKSVARRRRERMVTFNQGYEIKWWLDPDAGMLTSETLQALKEFYEQDK